jgi:hypothetical protein
MFGWTDGALERNNPAQFLTVASAMQSPRIHDRPPFFSSQKQSDVAHKLFGSVIGLPSDSQVGST